MNHYQDYKISGQVYIHRLNAQELGYRKGEPGMAGRYFYISKNCVKYFPPLSEVVLNDYVVLDLIPPNSDNVVLTKFVYHNDSHAADGTRDEFRLYLNSGNDPGRDFYKPEELVMIVKLEVGSESDSNFVYKVVHFSVNDSPGSDYQKVNAILNETDPRYKSHALVPTETVGFLTLEKRIRIGEKVIPREIIDASLEEPIQAPVQYEDPTSITPIIRSNTFRDLVLFFYDFRCAVTNRNVFINYKDLNNLEAAHILARASGGGSNPANGLALERNLHWAFDKGFFTVTTEYAVEVHPKAMHIEYLKDKHGQTIHTPEDSRIKPNKQALEWHNKNVFGLFLRSQI